MIRLTIRNCNCLETVTALAGRYVVARARGSRVPLGGPRARPLASAPSPPKISADPSPKQKSRSKSRSKSRERKMDDYNKDREVASEDLDQSSVHASPGDWFCKCGSYNFKRRQVCYKRNCMGKRSEGTVYGGDTDKTSTLEANAGITKRLLFRRLDALTTEEKILEAIKERCSKSVLDSIVGITIGREALTGASKCLAYILFGSIADSTAAHSELLSLSPPLVIDNREVLISFYNEPQKLPKPTNSQPTVADYSAYYAQMQTYNAQAAALSEADRVNAAAAVAQSAISAAHARNMQAWTPMAAPTFVTSTTQVIPAGDIPTGDGKTTYTPPDVRTFMYDETSGYYYDPSTGLYYDGASKGSADIGFSVLGARPSAVPQTQTVVREISPPPPVVADDFLMKKTMAEPLQVDSDDGIIDWMKLTCLICKRRFPTAEVLTKHKTLSDLHKQNLAEHRKKMELMPQPNGYRDRAAERRMKFGEDEPIIRKRYSPPPAPMAPPQSAPPPNVVDTIGGKMLQKMGWSMGRGLGKTEQGRTAPVEASAGPAETHDCPVQRSCRPRRRTEIDTRGARLQATRPFEMSTR
ncbi:g-patch domain-containing protein [Phthorimaea operculella]|nr:g-patch domain-containing protein [Phthorimaea operculella]